MNGLDLPDRLDDKRARAFTLLGSETVPAEAREEQRDRAERVITLTQKLSSPTAFEKHLADKIAEAYRAAERGDRDEPRCTCGSPNCPILEGEVPSALRTRGLRSSDTYRDATQFMMDHPGDPAVVSEALEEWHELRAELYSEIELLHGALQAAREERKREMGPSAPDSTAEEAPADD
jgi:hypothetical protein